MQFWPQLNPKHAVAHPALLRECNRIWALHEDRNKKIQPFSSDRKFVDTMPDILKYDAYLILQIPEPASEIIPSLRIKYTKNHPPIPIEITVLGSSV